MIKKNTWLLATIYTINFEPTSKGGLFLLDGGTGRHINVNIDIASFIMQFHGKGEHKCHIHVIILNWENHKNSQQCFPQCDIGYRDGMWISFMVVFCIRSNFSPSHCSLWVLFQRRPQWKSPPKSVKNVQEWIAGLRACALCWGSGPSYRRTMATTIHGRNPGSARSWWHGPTFKSSRRRLGTQVVGHPILLLPFLSLPSFERRNQWFVFSVVKHETSISDLQSF